MSKCGRSLPTKRERYSVGGLCVHVWRSLLTTCSTIDARGFRWFLRNRWEPFESQFQSIETSFIDHVDIVQLSGAKHQMHFPKEDTQSKQRQEGEYYTHRVAIDQINLEIDETPEERHSNILEWLSSADFEDTHERHFCKRLYNTGEWFLNDPCFVNWRDEAQSRLLWCYGARKFQP